MKFSSTDIAREGPGGDVGVGGGVDGDRMNGALECWALGCWTLECWALSCWAL